MLASLRFKKDQKHLNNMSNTLQRYEVSFTSKQNEEEANALQERLERLNNEIGPLFAHLGRGPGRRNRSFLSNGHNWIVVGTMPQKKAEVAQQIQNHGFVLNG